MCFPFLFFCGLFFHLLCVFIVSLFLFCVVFPLLFLLVILLSVSFLFEAQKKENKEKRPTTKGNNKEGKEKGRERKPPKQRRIFGEGFLFCFCSAVYL